MSLQDCTELEPRPKRPKQELQGNDSVVKDVGETEGRPSSPDSRKDEERDFLPPFEGFSVDSVLSVYPRSKTITVLGKFSGSSEAAVIVAEKVPLTEADLSSLFSSETKLNRSFQNDIYAQYAASCARSIGDLKLMTVFPASEAHVQKYSFQKLRMVHETPEDYRTITKPFIEKQSLAVEVIVCSRIVSDLILILDVAIGLAGSAYRAMYVHAHSCTRLYLDTDTTQLALNPMVSL